MDVTKSFLLPNYFKKVAAVLFSIDVIFAGLLFSELLAIQSGKAIFFYGLILSMLVHAVSKEETEDELIVKLRMHAFAGGFLGGVTYILIKPLSDLLIVGSPFLDESSYMPIFLMLVIFHSVYWSMKRQL